MSEPADVQIAAVTPAANIDPREIAMLQIVSWAREPSEEEVARRAARLEAEIASLDPRSKGIFLATIGAEPVGTCRVARDENDPGVWWLVGIVVHPRHRRRGIGRALARAGIAYARARGANLIRSETHADNRTSILFHSGLGFKSEAEFTASDGDRKVAFRLQPD